MVQNIVKADNFMTQSMGKVCHNSDKEKLELKFTLQSYKPQNVALTSSLYLQKDAEITIGGSFRGGFSLLPTNTSIVQFTHSK